MALYTDDSKDRVRDAVDFVELVSARTELRRAGPARYEGLCPFHDERTPSFGIDPAQKVYYCFGCQAAGDVFTFVKETEGVDFKGALELLADRYGVELEREREDPQEAERRRRRERLLELLARTTAYYERYLWESSEAEHAREYLKGRGIGEEILREFRVGYAPSAWDRVLMASRGGGFSVQELYATGLAQRSKQNGQPYDRFRSRIMFPLTDIRGRVLGFGARAMREEQGPKYLNTSDNDLYHKGSHLYGADLARIHAAKRERGDRVRGLHGYDRPPSGGHSQRGRSDGHCADGRAGRRTSALGADGVAGVGRRQRWPRRDAARVQLGEQAQAQASRGVAPDER